MNNNSDLLCIENDGALHITVGRLYKSTKRGTTHTDLKVMDNGCLNGGNYQNRYFKDVVDLSTDELIELAKSLVGHSIVSSNGINKWKIEAWDITNKSYGVSGVVQVDVLNRGVSVYIKFGSRAVPLRALNEYTIDYAPSTEKVYLNDSYSAVVSATHVEVGCQKFPIEVIENVLAASKRLR